MKFERALHEAQFRVNPVSSGTGIVTPMQKIWARGIKTIKVDEGGVPDVHGIPPGFDQYGRGGFDKKSGQIWLDGGSQGSATGHPNYIEDGFYWGIKYPENTLYLAGRVRGEENTARLTKYLNHIIMAICNVRSVGAPPKQYRLPQPGQASVASKITTVNRSDLIGRKPAAQRPAASTRKTVSPSGYSNWG